VSILATICNTAGDRSFLNQIYVLFGTPAIVTNLPNRRLRCELRRAVRPGGRLWATQHEPRGTPFQFTIPRLQADRDHVDVSVSRRLEREAERNVEVMRIYAGIHQQ
jgi:hypothetical protein